jgi:hypothetical protein
MPAPTTAAKHLTVREMDLIDKTVRKDGASPLDACRAVARGRERRGENPFHKSSIYRYLAGDTHRRGAKEKRDRKRLLSAADATRLDQTRRRLIAEADNEWVVTHRDIASESFLLLLFAIEIAMVP